MCELGIFQLPSELTIEAAYESSITRLSLCLQEHPYHLGDGFSSSTTQRPSMEPFLSISGFPRKLWTAGSGQFFTSIGEDEEEDIGEIGQAISTESPPVPEIYFGRGEAVPRLRETTSRLFGRRAFSWSSRQSSSPRLPDGSSPSRDSRSWGSRDSMDRGLMDLSRISSGSDDARFQPASFNTSMDEELEELEQGTGRTLPNIV